MTTPRLGAILLVGGRATRLGGGVKPLIEVGGQTLLSRVVTAARDAGCAPIIAVGPELDPAAPVRWVQENPPFSGPAAAIAAALEALDDAADDRAPGWMLVLAGDLPHADAVATRLASAAAGDAGDAVIFRAGDRPQWLAGAYRASALRDAVRDLGDALTGASCRALLGGLEIAWLADDDGITADVDTPADLARVRAAFEEEP